MKKVQSNNPLRNISITLWLILINVTLFIVFYTLILTNKIPLNFIALQPDLVLQGQNLWTFLTSMFMHGGIAHLFFNMVSLFFIGSLVEKILGHKRYLFFYIFSGLFAGLFFVVTAFFFNSGLSLPAVGASGALFALVGFLMLITPNLPVFVFFIPIPIKLKYAGPGLLALLWIISLAGNIPIGNSAHFGGLIAGLIYGVYIRSKYKRKVQMIGRAFS